VREKDGSATKLLWLIRDVTAERRAELGSQELRTGIEQQVLTRTAQLESIAKLSQAALAQEEAHRRACRLVAIRRAIRRLRRGRSFEAWRFLMTWRAV
jgi:hypothetical protein